MSPSNSPRSDDASWMVVDRSTSPSASTMSFSSDNTFGGDTASLRSISPASGASLSDTETLSGDTVDEEGEVDSGAFTVTSAPGGIPPRGSFDSEIVEVTVGRGAESRTFETHEALLGFYSKYFKMKLDGGSTHVALPTVAPRLFAVFVHWLYTRQVPEGNEYDTSSSTGKLCTRVLCELWVFGAKYKILQLQKDMVTKIVERVMHSAWKDPDMHVDFVYEHAPNSCLKELVMDLDAYSRRRSAGVTRVQQYSWMQEEEISGGLEVTLAQPRDLALWDLRQYHYMTEEEMEEE